MKRSQSLTFEGEVHRFSRQDYALNFRKEHQRYHGHQLLVFSEEPPHEPLVNRVYMVATCDAMWNYIQSLPIADRHVYELIEEGMPCHLYFDLECSINSEETTAPAPPTVTEVEHALLEALNSVSLCGARTQILPQHLLILESFPSPQKFSLHVIVKLPTGHMFPDNAAAGYIVKTFLQPYMAMTLPGYPELIDQCVYSRNRTFRCAFCCKRGKNAYLRLAPQCQHPDLGAAQVFHASLITSQENGLSGRVQLLENIGDPSHDGVMTSATQSRNSVASGTQMSQSSYLRVTGFHRVLDEYIRENVDNSGFRDCKYCPEYRTVAYSLRNSRYCGNVGREHKSNGTYVVVCLKNNTISQRCFDHGSCKGYRGPEVPLPDHVAAALKADTLGGEVATKKELNA